MNVCMLKPTRWDGKSLAEGDTVDVDGSVGKRWIQNGIAAPCEAIATVDTPVAPPVAPPAEDTNKPLDKGPYDGMKPKELYDLCVEKGLEVEAKKAAAYYIEKLTAAEAGSEQ